MSDYPKYECIICGESIEGDLMKPETADGPMHPDCFPEWVNDA